MYRDLHTILSQAHDRGCDIPQSFDEAHSAAALVDDSETNLDDLASAFEGLEFLA